MPKTDPADRLVAEYTKDWKRLRAQKARRHGGVEARVLTNLGIVFGEHYLNYDNLSLRARATDADKNRLWLTFNLVGRAVWRKMGRLWSIDHHFRATPDTLDPAAFDQADIVTDLIRALSKKAREGQLHWNRLFWLLIGGVVIEHTPWMLDVSKEPLPVIDPETDEVLWKDAMMPDRVIPQAVVEREIASGATPERFRPAETLELVGDVGAEIYTPLDFFIDASVKAIRDLSADQACYLASIKTVGWVREQFGSDAAKRLQADKHQSILQTKLLDQGKSVANLSMRDLVPALQGSTSPDDPECVIFLTRYSPRSEARPSGSRTLFTPDGIVLDDDDMQYREIPCTDIHWKPNATSFWSGDFVTDMVPAQKFLNRRMSQLGEASNAQIHETLLLGGGLTTADIPTDYPGVVQNGLSESGAPLVVPMQRGQLPGWFVESIRLIVEFIEAVGAADLLTQRKFPGQLRGPLAIPMLQEILDSEDGPFYTHLGEALAEVHQKRVNLVQAYYPPVRTLHYLGQNNRDEVMVFHKDEVLPADRNYAITVDSASLLPELSSIREARVRERLESPLSILYVNKRTGKIDPSKIAHDLKYGDRERESREAQYRKLARQLIAKLWAGFQLDPALPMPFWDHDVMLDELEAAMATTEWLEASQPTKLAFIDLYNKHRQFLQAIHAQAQSAMEGQMIQSAVAQATQQAAAKAASLATEQALEQVAAQGVAAQGPPSLTEQVAAQLQTQRQPGPAQGPLPNRGA